VCSGSGWQFWIDRGGTFTDLVGRAPSGELVVRKVLSEQPGQPGDPAVAAMRTLLGVGAGLPLPPGAVEEVRLGTTVATNALLEGQGAPTLLLITRGFADALWIGDQHRPDLFALGIERPAPLYRQVLEVEGRLAADGQELAPLRLDAELEEAISQARTGGISSCAVALLHSCRHPRQERQLGDWLQRFDFHQVVLSHRVGLRPRLLPRAQTSVVEACVAPVLAAYLERLQRELGPHCRLRVMQSSGGLIAPELLCAKDTILSGPAGGLVAAVKLAGGSTPIVGFDMGGTSTDVFHAEAAGPGSGNGRGDGVCRGSGLERLEETEIAGLRLQAERLPIHTVAAGGGSRLHFDGQRLQVGPASAGADPGPACYRRGGPLTITDANLLLGRLQPAAFPAVFGPGGDQGPDPELVSQLFEELAERVALATGRASTPEALAEGALAIANDRMAEAIRRISIQRGHDIRGATLVCYGGAGGQHACALAERLGIRRLLLHPLAGVLSAYGIGLADQRLLREEVVREPLDAALVARLRQRAAALVEANPAPRAEFSVGVRLAASELTLPLPLAAAPALREAFERAHRQRFGHGPEGDGPEGPDLVVEWLLVELVDPGPEPEAVCPPPSASPQGGKDQPIRLYWGGEWHDVPLHRREDLPPAARLSGPALVVEANGSLVLAPGWRAELQAGEILLLTHTEAPGDAHAHRGSEAVDPVSLELFNHRFSAVAEQMGVRLQQSARSVNIRERLDFSCAVFDGAGELVANAPHIPVHLGSMGASVAGLLAAVRRGDHPALRPGDGIVSNHPAHGGTHLPDLTVITPVFTGGTGNGNGNSNGNEQPFPLPDFFLASRGHHADVGGITPGSMPPFSQTLEQEGLLLDNVPLLRQGKLLADDWRRRLAAGPWPVRNPEQLLADLQAQVAANQLGAGLLQALAEREGLGVVRAYMAHVQDNGAEAVRQVIDRLTSGQFRLPLDGGLMIEVAVRIDRRGRRAVIDFSGTSGQDGGNRNAPLAITQAVVLYVFRCLVGKEVPLNAGCYRPLQLIVPPGSLLHPGPEAAVVAGNVETSQAIANALFGALGVMAAAQGTMNNLSFGDSRHQYYETICGGCGAGRQLDGVGFAGASAVQSHMTNSRLTDPEILEERFPVRLESFALRRGSGGSGRWPGGDGVVREIRFLEPMTAAILSGSRQVAPFGLAGGGPGQPGRNRWIGADGREQELGGSIELAVEAGDRLIIETPGGGGYGKA